MFAVRAFMGGRFIGYALYYDHDCTRFALDVLPSELPDYCQILSGSVHW